MLPIITTILNTSLTTGHFPALFKSAIIQPHMKKSNLESDEQKKIETGLDQLSFSV